MCVRFAQFYDPQANDIPEAVLVLTVSDPRHQFLSE